MLQWKYLKNKNTFLKCNKTFPSSGWRKGFSFGLLNDELGILGYIAYMKLLKWNVTKLWFHTIFIPAWHYFMIFAIISYGIFQNICEMHLEVLHSDHRSTGNLPEVPEIMQGTFWMVSVGQISNKYCRPKKYEIFI